MPRKPDNPEQSKRFMEMAREIGAGEKPDNFEKVFGKLTERAKVKAPSTASPRSRKKTVRGP